MHVTKNTSEKASWDELYRPATLEHSQSVSTYTVLCEEDKLVLDYLEYLVVIAAIRVSHAARHASFNPCSTLNSKLIPL